MEELRLNPVLENLKRGGPAVILPKDIGPIIAYTGVGKDSICIEAGTGSAFLTVSLANICKKVYTYEKDEKFFEFAKENIKRSFLENIEIQNKDIVESGFDVKFEKQKVDLVMLDMPHAERAVKYSIKVLKKGKFLVGYLTNLEQVKEFVKECEHEKFQDIFTIETIEREYLIKEKGTRPVHQGLMHTAYLVFARK
ncbi:methyltransferase domain-containing protein [Candidatus Micrarchaeota archaeon]|jgi:tRNA (adenine57-N1/adenine58-N1)-methyltransferase|nr:methyltransferase domain-containing protein [Candidatus Micrarchaeota archaeon]